MKKFFTGVIILISIVSHFSCHSGSGGSKLLCDTVCFRDSVKFTDPGKLQPLVYISAVNCRPDTIGWTYKGMGVFRKMGIGDIFGSGLNLNRSKIACLFNDTVVAVLLFNDCATGRGYQLKLRFNKTDNIRPSNRGINHLDPKYHIEGNLIAYTDRGNLFVEDIDKGKTTTLTFGKALAIDFDALHNYIDSVNISSKRIWAKVKVDNNWKEVVTEDPVWE